MSDVMEKGKEKLDKMSISIFTSRKVDKKKILR